jgi:acetylornithine deacetylase/succinyl-diaminopimelate desuccinylase-like protein
MSAYIPPICELFLDLRIGPRSSPGEARAELQGLLDRVRPTLPEFELSSEMTVAIPGTATPESSWIVRSLVRAWEEHEGRAHEAATGTSGATDVAVLRGHGIETARIGPPMSKTPSPYPGFSMGVADPESLATLTSVLLGCVVDTLGRPRGEIEV